MHLLITFRMERRGKCHSSFQAAPPMYVYYYCTCHRAHHNTHIFSFQHVHQRALPLSGIRCGVCSDRGRSAMRRDHSFKRYLGRGHQPYLRPVCSALMRNSKSLGGGRTVALALSVCEGSSNESTNALIAVL